MGKIFPCDSDKIDSLRITFFCCRRRKVIMRQREKIVSDSQFRIVYNLAIQGREYF